MPLLTRAAPRRGSIWSKFHPPPWDHPRLPAEEPASIQADARAVSAKSTTVPALTGTRLTQSPTTA
ncbi:hypothetical protein AB0I98_12550 [Streptomyces sp. NPDC050211]|uniref:hypothetical protein n=1 Tax=Streptomyces sp. NPDC050211 TaxID=3154932 RepID=UPI00341ED554